MPQPPKPVLLIVEDDPDQLFILELVAVRSGEFGRVIAIRTVEETIEHVQSTQDPQRLPHLILTDLRMPGRTGIDLIQEIAAIEAMRDVPVVVISDSDSPVDRANVMQAGARGFFRKPADLTTLTNFMKQLRQHWTATHAACSL